MMLMDIVSGVLASTGFGGVIGLLGTGFQHLMKAREEKMKFEHELQMRREDRADMIEESKLRVQEVETQIAGEVKIAETNMLAEELKIEGEAFLESFDNDKATYSTGRKLTGWWRNTANFLLTMVDVARGFIRPVITVWGIVILSYLVLALATSLGGLDALVKADTAKAWDIMNQVIQAIIFIAITSTTWWFGSRQLRKSSER